ncbi:MAG TPA: glycosyltransferase family 4 protein [Solirubrobacteraceae bacterium]|nr:glycosyltransferase family 4 protein [Solirubrobacteraceae bacterium]
MSDGKPRRTVAAFHLGEPSGPLRTLAPVLARLAEEGEVIIALPEHGRAVEELAPYGKVVVTAHEPLMLPRTLGRALSLPLRLRRDIRRFRGLLRRHRADLAIIATRTLPALTFAARLERVPVIVYTTELYRLGDAADVLREPVWRAIAALNAGLADVTVSPSRTVADGLRSRTPSVVVHPSIDAAGPGDARAFAERHGIPDSGPRLATMGNITRGRAQDVAIRALAQLRRTHPGARLIVAGTPHPRSVDEAFGRELRALAAELGVDDAVHFCGFARPGDVFAACDVFVNPARFAETFGRAAMEALAAGIPVVSTTAGAIPELLRDGRDALLVPPDDPDALADAVRRLVDDRTFAEQIVRTGRDRVRSSYTVERQLEGFHEAIGVALGTR